MKYLRITLPILAVALSIGCSKAEPEDTSSPDTSNTTQRTETATQNIQSSNMTPEQKAAAARYMQQGAAGYKQMESQTKAAGSGTPK